MYIDHRTNSCVRPCLSPSLSQGLLFFCCVYLAGPSCSYFQSPSWSVVVTDTHYCIWFNMASGDTNIGPYLCVAKALPTELFPPRPR